MSNESKNILFGFNFDKPLVVDIEVPEDSKPYIGVYCPSKSAEDGFTHVICNTPDDLKNLCEQYPDSPIVGWNIYKYDNWIINNWTHSRTLTESLIDKSFPCGKDKVFTFPYKLKGCRVIGDRDYSKLNDFDENNGFSKLIEDKGLDLDPHELIDGNKFQLYKEYIDGLVDDEIFKELKYVAQKNREVIQNRLNGGEYLYKIQRSYLSAIDIKRPVFDLFEFYKCSLKLAAFRDNKPYDLREGFESKSYNLKDCQYTYELYHEIHNDVMAGFQALEHFGITRDAIIKDKLYAQTKIGKYIRGKTVKANPKFNLREYLQKIPHDEVRDALTYALNNIGDDGRFATEIDHNRLEVHLKDSVYRVGLGGVHLVDKSREWQRIRSDNKWTLYHADFGSFYPSILYKSGCATDECSKTYGNLVTERIRLKQSENERDREQAAIYKFILNIVFGQLRLSQQERESEGADTLDTHYITLIGQACALELMMGIESCGGRLLHCNTDGFYYLQPKGQELFLGNPFKSEWTGLELNLKVDELREMRYKDVNNYLSVDVSGKSEVHGGWLCNSDILNGFNVTDLQKCLFPNNDAEKDYLPKVSSIVTRYNSNGDREKYYAYLNPTILDQEWLSLSRSCKIMNKATLGYAIEHGFVKLLDDEPEQLPFKWTDNDRKKLKQFLVTSFGNGAVKVLPKVDELSDAVKLLESKGMTTRVNSLVNQTCGKHLYPLVKNGFYIYPKPETRQNFNGSQKSPYYSNPKDHAKIFISKFCLDSKISACGAILCDNLFAIDIDDFNKFSEAHNCHLRAFLLRFKGDTLAACRNRREGDLNAPNEFLTKEDKVITKFIFKNVGKVIWEFKNLKNECGIEILSGRDDVELWRESDGLEFQDVDKLETIDIRDIPLPENVERVEKCEVENYEDIDLTQDEVQKVLQWLRNEGYNPRPHPRPDQTKNAYQSHCPLNEHDHNSNSNTNVLITLQKDHVFIMCGQSEQNMNNPDRRRNIPYSEILGVKELGTLTEMDGLITPVSVPGVSDSDVKLALDYLSKHGYKPVRHKNLDKYPNGFTSRCPVNEHCHDESKNGDTTCLIRINPTKGKYPFINVQCPDHKENLNYAKVKNEMNRYSSSPKHEDKKEKSKMTDEEKLDWFVNDGRLLSAKSIAEYEHNNDDWRFSIELDGKPFIRLLKGTIWEIDGRGGAGKSMFALDAVLSLLTSDASMFGHDATFTINNVQRVLYVGLEEHIAIWHERVSAYESVHGKINLDGKFYALDITSTKQAEETLNKSATLFDLIIVDPWASFTIGKAEQGADATQEALSKYIFPILGNTKRSNVIVIHHSNKDSSISDDVSGSNRGSSALYDASKLAMHLRNHGTYAINKVMQTQQGKKLGKIGIQASYNKAMKEHCGEDTSKVIECITNKYNFGREPEERYFKLGQSAVFEPIESFRVKAIDDTMRPKDKETKNNSVRKSKPKTKTVGSENSLSKNLQLID